MRLGKATNPQRNLWTYGYVLVPPIARDRLGSLEVLLADGHAKASFGAFTWEGRFINGDDITHILVVTDRPDQDLEINQLLEAELARLEAPFSITAAMAIGGDSRSGTSARSNGIAPDGDLD